MKLVRKTDESASDVVDYGLVEQPEPSTLSRVPQSQYIDRVVGIPKCVEYGDSIHHRRIGLVLWIDRQR